MAGATRVGSYNVDSLDSMQALRDLSVTAASVGLEAYINQFWADRPGLGGGKFILMANSTSPDDGGYVNVRVSPDLVWRRVSSFGSLSLYDGGCRAGAPTHDNGPYFSNLTHIGVPVEFPDEWFTVQTPITIGDNVSLSLIARSPHGDNSRISWHPLPTVGADEYCITIGTTAGFTYGGVRLDGFTYGGVRLDGFTIGGNGNTNHGIKISHTAYLRCNGLRVIDFKGQGIYLNDCQDYFMVDTEVQKCGRTSGSYTSVADCTGDLVTHWPIFVYRENTTNFSNMGRWLGGQIENNNVTPYVYIRGGIGHWIEKMHMEHRVGPLAGGKKGDAISLYSCDAIIRDMQCSEFEWDVATAGFGTVDILGAGRGTGGIRQLSGDGTFTWRMVQCRFAKASPTSRTAIQASQCNLGNLNWTFPNRRNAFTDCSFGEFNVSGDSTGNNMGITNCTFTSVNCSAINNMRFEGGICTGDFTLLGSSNNYVATDIKGVANIQITGGIEFIPRGVKHKEVWHTGPVPGGTVDAVFPTGSKWHNMGALLSGDIVTQVKTPTGWVVSERLGLPPFTYAGVQLRTYTASGLPPAANNPHTIARATSIPGATPTNQLVYSDGVNWRLVASPSTTV